MRERQLSAGATSEPQEKSSTSVGPNAKDPPDLVALRPAAAYTHIRNMLAVVADHVVSKLWLKPKQELGPLRDLPWRVSCWMVASEPAIASMPHNFCRPAAFEVLERHSVDRGMRLAPDAATKLDDPIIADVDAVMVIEQGTLDLEVITRLESVIHAIRSYRSVITSVPNYEPQTTCSRTSE